MNPFLSFPSLLVYTCLFYKGWVRECRERSNFFPLERNFHQNRPRFRRFSLSRRKIGERERLWWLVYTDSSRRLIGFRARWKKRHASPFLYESFSKRLPLSRPARIQPRFKRLIVPVSISMDFLSSCVSFFFFFPLPPIVLFHESLLLFPCTIDRGVESILYLIFESNQYFLLWVRNYQFQNTLSKNASINH